jgi:hypothetical protein
MAVYTYGSGGTYASPQAAVDALFVDVSTNTFTEPHYIRGMAGTYDVESGEIFVVDLPELSPTSAFQLIFDCDGIVKWRGANKATHELCLLAGVEYVLFSCIQFIGQVLNVVNNSVGNEEGVTFEDCQIGNIESPEDTDVVHLCNLDKLTQLAVIRSIIVTEGKAIYMDNSSNDGAIIISIVNSVIQTLDSHCVENKQSLVTALIYLHSTFIAENGANYFDVQASPGGALLYALINCIFKTTNSTDACVAFTSLPQFVANPLSSDYNCFNPATAGALISLLNGAAVYDLEAVQENTNTNFNSFEDDPLLNDDWTLQADSPCIGTGTYIAGADANGVPRTLQDIDIGAIQISTSGYCTLAQVLAVIKVDPVDIGKDSIVERNAAIQNWIVEMSALIDDYCGQSWTEATVPRSIANTCARMVANFIVAVIQRNKSPIVKVGEYTIRNASDKIFTDDIKLVLAQNYKKRPLGIAMGSLDPDKYDE